LFESRFLQLVLLVVVRTYQPCKSRATAYEATRPSGELGLLRGRLMLLWRPRNKPTHRRD
jgi:hypothetical protein